MSESAAVHHDSHGERGSVVASIEQLLTVDLVPSLLRSSFTSALRIGMVGVGRIVQRVILPAYMGHGLNVVAAADPDPTAQDIARRLGIPHVFNDYRSMLESGLVDVVDINVRWDQGMSDLRLQAVRAAAASGIHVLIAKPVADTLDAALAIVEAAGKGGIILAANHNSRFAPALYGCHQLIKTGAVGALLSASIQWNAARGIQHNPEFDAVHDMSVHQVDVLLSWAEAEPTAVFANLTRRTPRGSVLAATLVFPGGVNCSIRDDFATEHRRTWDFAAVGELGSIDGFEDIEVPAAGQPRMKRATLRAGLHEEQGAVIELPLTYRYSPDAFYLTMADLLHSIETHSRPWSDTTSILRTMRTLAAIERSIRNGEVVHTGSVA